MFSSPLNILLAVLLSSSVLADNHLRPRRFGQAAHPSSPRTLRAKRQDGLTGGLAQALQGLGDTIGNLGDSAGLGPIVDPLVGTPVVNDPATQTTSESITATPTGSPTNSSQGTEDTPAGSPTDPAAGPGTTADGTPSTTPSGSDSIPSVIPTDSSANVDHTAPDPTETSTIPLTTTRGGGLIPTLSGILDPPKTTDPAPTGTSNSTDSSSSADSTPSSSDNGGILGPILGPSSSGDGGILGPILGTGTGTGTGTDTPPSTPAPTDTPTDTAGGASSTVDSNPTSSPSSSGDGGILGPILGPSSSDGGILGPILGPTSTDTSPPTSTPTDTGSGVNSTTDSNPTSSSDGGILGPILGPTSSDTPPPTDTTTQGPSETTVPKPTDTPPTTTTTSSSDGGILPTIISIPPILPTSDPNNTSSSTTGSSASDTGTGGGPTDSSTAEPSSSTTPPPSSTVDSPPPTNSTISEPPPESTIDSSSILTTSTISGSGLGEPTDIFPNSTVAPSVTPSTTVPVAVPTRSDDGAFSFVTASTLVFDTTSSTSTEITQTDPDAVASTTTAVPSSIDPTAAPVQSVLPSNMPSRIFSTTSVNPNSPSLAGHSLISILFTLDLNWAFVTSNNQTMGQLFRYMPSLIAGSLDIDVNNVYTYALQVSIPTGWKGDTSQLGSTYLVYISSDQIDTLASIMRTPTSSFYSQPGIPGQLATRVVPNSLVEVPPSELNSGFATGASNSSSGVGSSKKRTDAIIGVCVAIGGIVALIGIWWLVKYWQRQQAAKHKRLSNLSDPNASNGIYGTQHDERRTSFFYAEDELRGGYNVPQEENVMTQRIRAQAAGHGPISAPVLQQNSLNW